MPPPQPDTHLTKYIPPSSPPHKTNHKLNPPPPKKKNQLAIYSSGSREAQRLLFAHTAPTASGAGGGDLRRFLGCYFDTAVGGKREAGSYAQIALSLGT